MYPKELYEPMKQDLVQVGFESLEHPEAVDNALDIKEGTVFLVINSVCGRAAGAARPGAKMAVSADGKKPAKLVTVFAGVDTDAVQQARTYTLPYPPSSPAMALFKDGKLVHFIERHQIEGNNAQTISEHLTKVFNHYC